MIAIQWQWYAFVYGRLSFYDSHKMKWNKIKQTKRAQLMKRQKILSIRKQANELREEKKLWKYESLKCSIEWKTGQYVWRALVQYLFLINFLNCHAYQCWCDVLLMLAKIKHKCVPPQVHWASNACTYSSPVVLLSDFSEVRCARPFTK